MNNNQNSGSNEWERRVRKARTIPIQAMCKRLGIELPKKGKNGSFYGTCPVCDDEGRHFHVSPQKAGGRGLYFCRTCGSGGDSLSLFMAVRKTSFPEAVRELSDG